MIYEIVPVGRDRWQLQLDGVPIGRPYASKGEALSAAIARTGAVLVGGGLDRSAA